MPVRPLHIRGATGQKSLKIQQIVLLPLIIDKTLIETKFLIVPNLIRPIILGLDWLTNHKGIIDLNRSSPGIYIKHNNIEKFITFNKFNRPILCQVINTNTNSIETIRTGLTLEPAQIRELRSLLCKYEVLFNDSLGRVNCYIHKIKMMEVTPVIQKRSYPVPYA